jgi:hypothetical protein
VIIYHDTSKDRTDPPAWIADARNLQCRHGQGERWWGVGAEAWLVGDRPGPWHDLSDGWRCCLVGEVDPKELIRQQRWCDTEMAIDLTGRRWQAPIILGPDGEPIFRVTYGGKDFARQPTPLQAMAEEIARSARQALKSGGIEGPHSRQWAARALAITHHLDVEVIGVLGLLDDALVLTALAALTGYRLKREATA